MSNFCGENIVSDPKDLAISVVNTGSEDKTFRVLTGATGLVEVVDNIAQGPLELLSDPAMGFDSNIPAGFSIVDESINKAFFLIFTSFVSYRLIVVDTLTNLPSTSVDLSSFPGIGFSSPMYYYNGHLYILTTSGSSFFIVSVNTTTLTTVSTTVPSGGALRFGDIDTVNGFLYFTSTGPSILWKADLSNPASPLPLTSLNLFTHTSSDITSCKVGSNYIAVQGSPDLLFVNKNTFTYNSKITGAYSSYGDIQYGQGNFVFAANNGITFITESGLSVTDIAQGTSSSFFSKALRNDNTCYIASNSINSILAVDMVNKTAVSVPVTGSFHLGVQPSYNAFTDCLVIADSNNLYSLSCSDLTIQEKVMVDFTTGDISKNAIVSSNQTGLMYGPALNNVSGSSDLIYIFQKRSEVPVTITYNGGVNTSDYMQKSTISKPMKVLNMKIEASSFNQLSNLLQKIKKSSAGEVFNFDIRNLIKFDAYAVQYVVDFDGSELTDPIFDAIRYMQGTINANSSLNFHITYQEYSPENIVNDNCIPLKWKDELQPKKIKHCVFKGRGLKRFV